MNINTKITFSFDNKTPRKITGEFLLVRIQNTDHKSNLAKLFDRSTKSLKVKEANSLLRSILSAIIINFVELGCGVGDVPFWCRDGA